MTFSAAAAVAPVKLWNESCGEGSVFVSAKNTFLEFYNDEKKAIKRSACARSASADSHFTCERSSVSTTATHTPTNRSSSPSNRSQDLESLGSNDHPLSQGADLRSPGTSPRRYQHDDANHSSKSITGSGKSKSGYPPVLQIVPMMMPVMMKTVNDPEKETPPSTPVKPTKSDRLACKKQDLKKFNGEAVPKNEVTTLMVRGIPCSFSQEHMMKIIDHAGLRAKYNFFYLPRAGNNGSNLGYAFLNFVDNECATKCMNQFNGVPLDPSRSMKVCTISPADIQGLSNLRKHFRRTAVSRGCRGPVFLKTTYGSPYSKETTEKKELMQSPPL